MSVAQIDERTFAGSGSLWNLELLSKSICKISLYDEQGGRMGTGTGFCATVEGIHVLATNCHVVSSIEVARRSKCLFGYTHKSNNTKNEVPLEFDDKNVVSFWSADGVEGKELDFVFITSLLLDDMIARRCVVPLTFYSYPEALRDNEPVTVCGHPHGNTLSLSIGLVLPSCKGMKIAHTAGTQSGSSGSPIFKHDSQAVIGIHHSGNVKDKSNYGTISSQIIKMFKEQHVADYFDAAKKLKDEQDCKAIEYAAKNLQCKDCKNLIVSSSLRTCQCGESKHCDACIQALKGKSVNKDADVDAVEDDIRNVDLLDRSKQCACSNGVFCGRDDCLPTGCCSSLCQHVVCCSIYCRGFTCDVCDATFCYSCCPFRDIIAYDGCNTGLILKCSGKCQRWLCCEHMNKESVTNGVTNYVCEECTQLISQSKLSVGM
jgi:V8-like Glu-specific endopeptidase